MVFSKNKKRNLKKTMKKYKIRGGVNDENNEVFKDLIIHLYNNYDNSIAKIKNYSDTMDLRISEIFITEIEKTLSKIKYEKNDQRLDDYCMMHIRQNILLMIINVEESLLSDLNYINFEEIKDTFDKEINDNYKYTYYIIIKKKISIEIKLLETFINQVNNKKRCKNHDKCFLTKEKMKEMEYFKTNLQNWLQEYEEWYSAYPKNPVEKLNKQQQPV